MFIHRPCRSAHHFSPRMKRRYLRIVRRAYRYLRHPRIRNTPWLVALTKPLFSRNLWQPSRSTVASGLSIGLFCAMLPIPFQMLIAALAAMRAKANIPVAMTSCWVTNPFTHPPLIAFQIYFGTWIRQHLDFKLPFDKETTISFLGLKIQGSPADFTVGFLSSGILLSIIAYPLVYGMFYFIPQRSITDRPHKKRND